MDCHSSLSLTQSVSPASMRGQIFFHTYGRDKNGKKKTVRFWQILYFLEKLIIIMLNNAFFFTNSDFNKSFFCCSE